MPSDADNQKIMFEQKRVNYFKGTIAVACIYGTVALVMFLAAIFTQAGKSVLTDSLLAFTVTFIGGMIIVTTLLVLSILYAKPAPIVVMEYDNLKCPDYWNLIKTPEEVVKMYPEDVRSRVQYMCVSDKLGEFTPENLVNTLSTQETLTPSDTVKDGMYKSGSAMYQPLGGVEYTPVTTSTSGGTTTSTNGRGKIQCGVVFPDYFGAEDKKYNATEQNKLRCQYARTCGAPWTSTCPNN